MSSIEKQNATPSYILIVEDNPQSAELLQAYLEPLETDVRVAVDGIDAMQCIEAQVPDIILLDIMMPRMSGFEVCRKVKNNSQTRNVAVLMITALNETGDIERAIDCGADDFLNKPINKLEVLTRVKSLLKVRHLKSELERTLSYLSEIEKNERNQIEE